MAQDSLGLQNRRKEQDREDAGNRITRPLKHAGVDQCLIMKDFTSQN